ncbi:MAG: hypothetical protein HY644_07765 [Acidobacteria bacterium]|nr:hypothetical protein [Acidobacteriota bacterium]
MSQCCPTAASSCSNTQAMERRLGICPECGNKGTKVQPITVQSLVRPDRHVGIQETQYHYCATPECDVVYYSNRADLVFQKRDLTVRIGAKENVDPIPVCYCFGHTERSIQDEIESTGSSSAEEKIRAEIKGGQLRL